MKELLNKEGSISETDLKKLVQQKNAQIDLLNSTVTSGLKANWDDADYTLYYVNDGLCRMLGYTEEELLAKCDGKMTHLVYPPDLPAALEDCVRCFANSDEYSTEYRIERKDGSLIWVWDTGCKAKNEKGVTVINSVIADITKQRNYSDTIQKQTNFLQALYDTMPCGIVQFSLDDYRLLNANKALTTMTGYDIQDRIGKKQDNLFRILCKEDTEEAKAKFDEVLKNKTGMFECRIQRKDGSLARMSVNASVVINDEGIEVLQAVLVDVTEIDMTRKERNATYENIPGGVAKFLVDDRLSIVEANDNCYKMLEIERRQGGRGSGLAFVSDEDAEMVKHVMHNQSLTNSPIDVEYRSRTGTGSMIWVHLVGRYIGMFEGYKLYQCVLLDISQQKKAQEQLTRERERYRIAMGISADMIYEYNLAQDTANLYENIRTPAGDEVLKQTIEHYIVKLQVRGMVHPDDIPALLGVLRGENILPVEVRMKNFSDPSGELMWYHVQGTIVYENGKPAKVVGLIRNIDDTQKIKAEKEELQEIFGSELSRDYEHICKINTATGEYRTFIARGSNHADIPLTGRYDEQMEALLSTAVYQKDKEMYRKSMTLRAMIKALDREQKQLVRYYREQEKNGSLRWKCVSYNYFRQDRRFILLNVRDVHDVRMEQQKEENRFNVLLKETYENVLEVDVETGHCNIFFPNGINRYPIPKYSDYEQVINAYAKTYVLPEYRAFYLENISIPFLLQKLADSEEPYSIDFMARELDGSFSYKTRTMFLLTYDSNKRYIMSYLKDVTKSTLYRLEKEKEEEKSRQIIQDALAAAERANLAKTDFLSRMSHEIRTPLNAVIGLTAIAAASLDDREKVVNCISKIAVSSRFLLSIINDILDMARIENGKVSIAHEEFSLSGFLTGITSIVYPQAISKGVIFEAVIDGLTPEYYIGDAFRLNQVLINILSNAIKFTSKGGTIKFSIKQVKQTKTHAYLRFTVRDTGIGMTEEQLRHVFEAFEQADVTISRRYGGSGLGLAISKNLVSLMNGTITVSSKPGEGSEFVVDVPLETLEKDYQSGDETILKNINVLVADDDIITCEHTTLVLSSMGISADYTTSGQRAIDLVQEAADQGKLYDVMFIDWKMPDVDGIEVTKAIRRIAGEDTLVIIMSAYDWSDIEKKAREVGVNFFIAKPMFQSSIQEVLVKSLRHIGGGQKLDTHKDYDFTGRRILLVEDNEINMEIAQALLEMKNAQVETATNGQIAVDMFSASVRGYYDVILMDVRMPVMDGLEATRTIRALEREDAALVPIFAMTANAFLEDVESSKSSGMNEHLAKPIETESLYAMLQRYFLRQGAGLF